MRKHDLRAAVGACCILGGKIMLCMKFIKKMDVF